MTLEDLADGCEEEVQVAVDDADVEGEEEDDGREEEHFCGAHDAEHEEVFGGAACVEGGAEIGVAGFFLEFLGFAGEDCWGVGFADGDEGADGDGTALYNRLVWWHSLVSGAWVTHSHGQNPECPSPAFGLGKIPTGCSMSVSLRVNRVGLHTNRPNNRTDQWPQSPSRHGTPSLLLHKHIRNRPSSNRQRRTPRATGKEPKNSQTANLRRNGASDSENDIEHITHVVYDAPTEDL